MWALGISLFFGGTGLLIPAALRQAFYVWMTAGECLGWVNSRVILSVTYYLLVTPMRLLMSKGGAPHHGFAAFYAYLERIFNADAVIHVGTHGALEFMPGKQVGLSGECWPDRLIGELPNLYIYSVNNPSEGTIAKRRSYAELISYLTPPIENAGLYKGLATLKDFTQPQKIDVALRQPAQTD